MAHSVITKFIRSVICDFTSSVIYRFSKLFSIRQFEIPDKAVDENQNH